MDWPCRSSDLAPRAGRPTTAVRTGHAAPVSSGLKAAEQQNADDDSRRSCDLKPAQLLPEQDVGGQCGQRRKGRREDRRHGDSVAGGGAEQQKRGGTYAAPPHHERSVAAWVKTLPRGGG